MDEDKIKRLFEKQAGKITTLAETKTFTDDEKRSLYAYYKQATSGDINIPRPGILNPVARAKWDAWNSQKGVSEHNARINYIACAQDILEKYK